MTEHSAKPAPFLAYYVVYFIIAGLTILTVALSFTPGPWRLPVSLAIASIQGILLTMVFMHLKDSDHITWLVAGGLFWMLILFVITITDYLTRQYGAI